MGSEFLLVYLPLSDISIGTRKQNLREIVDGLSEDDLSTFIDETACETVEEARDLLRTELEEYPHLAHRRSCTMVSFEGLVYVFSGGMSYGDDPSESYTAMSRIATVDKVWDILKMWSTEDIRAFKETCKQENNQMEQKGVE